MPAGAADTSEASMCVPSVAMDGRAGVDLYWIPVGSGGAWSVRLNLRIYEAIAARLQRRRPLDLYHAALEVHLPDARFVVEMTPIPDADSSSRGVVAEGPVGSRWIARLRVFRYEVRSWRDGVIPDAGEAVASPQRLSDDPQLARRLLDLVGTAPSLVWGRDQSGVGDPWSSNSLISWLLVRSGLPAAIQPPTGGRAPGWRAGIVVADRHLVVDDDRAEFLDPPEPVASSTPSEDGDLVEQERRDRPLPITRLD